MRKLLFLVLILTASARSPVHDENLPFRDQPFDHVVKVDVSTVVIKEPKVQPTEAEQDPLMQDEPVADVVETDSLLLEPERREEHRITEETSAIVEEPVLEADYLTEDMPEAELEPEPEIAAIQMNRNNIPVEEPVVELESVAEMEYEKEENYREDPTLEGDFIVEEDPEEVLEPMREQRMALQTEQDPLMQDEPVADVVETDSLLLEPERREEHRITEETSAIVEEPVLEADYLTEDMPEAELEPEPEIAAIQMNRNNIPVEEPAVELESVAEMEYEKEENYREEPTLEGDFIVEEDPEEVLEPMREQRMALQTVEQDPLMQDEPVADVVETDSLLLEPERREEHRITEETSAIVEEPVLEADYLTEDMPEAELEPEPEIAAIQMNRNNIPVEEPVVEMKMEVESDQKNVQGDYILNEDPEEVIEPARGPRLPLQTGRWYCRGVIRQGKCYQFFRRNLDANTAEVI
ncbi:probable serine/threonine-protein kinase kinX isoform X2 [Pseudorasbora parva]|uniref:probable serine/threonine-protein kinase kinX isoform X2 n=1 Tax=Pseudorasbora parva TaxID=51549 RepID=UPI00351E21E9